MRRARLQWNSCVMPRTHGSQMCPHSPVSSRRHCVYFVMSSQKLRKRKVPMDVKQREQTMIEFLLLTGNASSRRVWRSRVLARSSVPVDKPGSERRGRASTRETPGETASIRNQSSNPRHHQRPPVRLIADNRSDVGLLPRNDSCTFIAFEAGRKAFHWIPTLWHECMKSRWCPKEQTRPESG
jgi:hypothetical protein